jgi:CrcB protein
MSQLLLVCLGGAAGSGARFLLATYVTKAGGGAFPWGTLAVNLVGCFVFELLVGALAQLFAASDGLRLALLTGVLGGFTTYSAFNGELLALVRIGELARAGLYVAATLGGAVVFGVAGALLGRLVAGGGAGA